MNRIFGEDRPGRVLAFGAHPDDLEVGAGGLLSRLVDEGADVTMVVTSVPTQFDERKREALDGAKVVGARSVVLVEKPCRIEDIKMHDLVSRYDSLVADVRPDLVITHSKNDMHWDHGLVNRATISALRRTSCDLLAFLSSPEFNAQSRNLGQCFVNISEYMETKLEAIRQHTTQLPRLDLEARTDLARAMGRMSGYQYAEAYEVLRLRL